MENLENKTNISEPIVEKLEDLTTNEILFQIKQYEADHEAIKLRMIKDYDKMVELEKKFDNFIDQVCEWEHREADKYNERSKKRYNERAKAA